MIVEEAQQHGSGSDGNKEGARRTVAAGRSRAVKVTQLHCNCDVWRQARQ